MRGYINLAEKELLLTLFIDCYGVVNTNALTSILERGGAFGRGFCGLNAACGATTSRDGENPLKLSDLGILHFASTLSKESKFFKNKTSSTPWPLR